MCIVYWNCQLPVPLRTICDQKKGWAQVAVQHLLSQKGASRSLVIREVRAWSPMSTGKQARPKLASFWSGKELQRAVQSSAECLSERHNKGPGRRVSKSRHRLPFVWATLLCLSPPYIVWATLLCCWHPAAPTSAMAEGLDLRCLCTKLNTTSASTLLGIGWVEVQSGLPGRSILCHRRQRSPQSP